MWLSQALQSLPVLGGPGAPALIVHVPALAPTGQSSAPPVALGPAIPPAAMPQDLPQWVQTRVGATLWSGPDQKAQPFSTLPAWSFLQVVGVSGDRLRVQYTGDGGQHRPGPGWVSLNDVVPSDASGTWLENFRATLLYTDKQGSATIQAAPLWSSMLQTGDQSGDRIPVRLYNSDFSKVLGEGWIPAADVGPRGAPAQGVSTATQSGAPAAVYPTHDAFIAGVGQAAKETSGLTGVPASVTLAQAILESDWGTSLLTRQANNYFGIKASGGIGNNGAVWMRTMEYDVAANPYYIQSPFRAYTDMAASVTDHADLFHRLPRYAAALQASNDPNEFARRIQAAGYSTDPSYADKLIALMQKYNLYQFDH